MNGTALLDHATEKHAQYEGYRRIACAVIETAFKDLRSKSALPRFEARYWLWTEGIDWIDLLGVDIQREAFLDQVLYGGFEKC